MERSIGSDIAAVGISMLGLMMIGSCTDGGQEGKGGKEPPVAQDTLKPRVKSALEQYVDRVYGVVDDRKSLSTGLTQVLDSAEWSAALEEFKKRFDVNATNPFKWGDGASGSYQQTILAGSLQMVMAPYNKPRNEADASKDTLAGVMFHYGVSDNKFYCGVTPLALYWSDPAVKDSLAYDTAGMPFYEVTSTGALNKTDRTAWRSMFWKQKYVGKVRVRFSDIDIRTALDMNDAFAEGEVMLYKELQNVNDHTKQAAGSERRFVITCICEPQPKNLDDIVHRVAVHVRDDGSDRLDNEPHGHYSTNRAVELGSPCPPRCKRYPVPQ